MDEEANSRQAPVQGKAGRLEAQGWIRRFSIEAERVDEYVELYQAMGDEVRVEAVTSELMVAGECTTCLLADGDRFVIIYTRSRA